MKPPEMGPDDCRAVLARLGLTRTGLARLLGVDKDTLGRAERGEGRFAGTYRLLVAALDAALSPEARDVRDVALCAAPGCEECDRGLAVAPHVQAEVNDLLEFLAGAVDGRSRPRGKP